MQTTIGSSRPQPWHSVSRVLQALRWQDWASDKIAMLATVAAYLALTRASAASDVQTLLDVLVFVFVFAPASSAFGYLLNDWGDRALDAAHGKRNTFEVLGKRRAYALLVLSTLLMILSAGRFAIRPLFALETALFLFITVAYSLPPIRLKERGAAGLAIASVAQWTLPVLLVYSALGAGWNWEMWLFVAIQSVHGATIELGHQRADRANDARTDTRTLAVRLGSARLEAIYRAAVWADRAAIGTIVALVALAAPGQSAFSAVLAVALVLGYVAGVIGIGKARSDPYNGAKGLAARVVHDLVPHLGTPGVLLAALTLREPVFAVCLAAWLLWRIGLNALADAGRFPWWLDGLSALRGRAAALPSHGSKSAAPLVAPREDVEDSSRLARSGLSLLVLAMVERLAGFAFTLVAVRFLAPEAFGTYALIQALLLIGGMAINPGVELVVVRTIGRDRAQAPSVFSATLLLSVACAALAWIGTAVVMLLGNYPDDVRQTVTLAGAALVAMAISQTSTAVLKAFERMAVFAAISGGLSLLLAGLGIVALVGGGGLQIVVGMLVGKALVEAIVLLAVTARLHVPLRLRWDAALLRSIVVQAAPLALLSGYLVLITRADMVILGNLRGVDEVAVYGSATRITDALALITASLLGALAPRAAARLNEGRHASSRVYTQSLVFFALLSLPFACVLSVLAVPILTLVFGGTYAEGATSLRLLAWSNVGAAMSGPASLLLMVAAARTRAMIVSGGLLVALNLVLTFVFVDQWGASGAATATLVSSVANLVVSMYLASPYLVGLPRFDRLFGRPLLAALALLLAMLATQHLPAVISAAVGFAAYGAMLLVLGEHREPRYQAAHVALDRLRRRWERPGPAVERAIG